MDASAWNDRYAGTELVWTAEPNRFVVDQFAAAGPGTALDLACGEGRNAVWLAGRGWSVRAVDFAEAGIVKGRQLAVAAGVDVNWVVADVTRYDARATFELVLMAYLHLPWPAFVPTLAKAIQALAAGGTLLVVGHHVDNLEGALADLRTPQSCRIPRPSRRRAWSWRWSTSSRQPGSSGPCSSTAPSASPSIRSSGCGAADCVWSSPGKKGPVASRRRGGSGAEQHRCNASTVG